MTVQSSIAHYRVTAKLGKGGMGEVWRATDTKLGRDVAIKILPEGFAQDPGRLARFEREAKILASLNHPNIAAIYGVEEGALVMELVEGEPLSGPLPLGTALDYARQIADALDAAHGRGIVHRDLKPGNILVTASGVVKVLDFGLAKAAEEPTGDTQNSATITLSHTRAGVILGTAAYMSPEQARGKAVDKRADIWAFGCVLYELLTGKQAFTGDTTTDVLAAVVSEEPDLTRIPVKARRLIECCLKKDPKQRLQAIADWRLLLESAETPVTARTRNRWLWIAAGVLVAALAVAGAGWWRATRPVDHPLTRLNVDLGPEAVTGTHFTAAISPDGRRLVYAVRGPNGRQQLATRLLDEAQPTLLPDTESGREPFFSPDGQWIGFIAGMHLEKISVQGGAPVVLTSTPTPMVGADWGEDGNIVAGQGVLGPLCEIPAAGGTLRAITKLGPGELSHRWPQILPGGSVLFTASASVYELNDANIEVFTPKTGKTKILLHGGYYCRYLPSGHLVYLRQGVLFGVKFDPTRLEVHGTPVPLLDDMAANPAAGGVQFDFSRTGTLVYASGKGAIETWRLDWLDSSGKLEPLMAKPGAYAVPRLSPDGRRLVFTENGHISVYDLQQETTTRLTFTANATLAIWAPDGRHILFRSGSGLFWMRSDGAGDPYRLFQRPTNPAPWSFPWSFSPDGKRLAYFDINPGGAWDMWTLPLDLTDPDHPKPGKPEPFRGTSATEMVPRFSPDGRWIAYRSYESGTPEIYVRRFPATSGGKWQISTGGGLYGLWSNNRRELFYETLDNRIMVVDYTVNGASFTAGRPRLWSDKQLFYTGTSNLDVAPDGKRFVVLSLPEAAGGEQGFVHTTILLNFFDQVKRRIP